MKRFLCIIFLSQFLLLSCDEELPINKYELEILNESTQTLTIESYFEGILQNTFVLNTGESDLHCEYSLESFIGYWLSGCNIDRIVFRFSNGKGYISDANINSGFNFSNNEGVFGPSERFIESQEGVRQFIITQNDFDNALDIP